MEEINENHRVCEHCVPQPRRHQSQLSMSIIIFPPPYSAIALLPLFIIDRCLPSCCNPCFVAAMLQVVSICALAIFSFEPRLCSCHTCTLSTSHKYWLGLPHLKHTSKDTFITLFGSSIASPNITHRQCTHFV